jgi:hypothetical protein
MPRNISEVIARRTDLGTFLVHLTRGETPEAARANLESILVGDNIEARAPLGHAYRKLQAARIPTDSQRCVCFSETPLEHVHLLTEEIAGRIQQFTQYGVALPKKLARRLGINPVWYVDMTPGHDWLTQPIDELIDAAIASGRFAGSPIERLAPFVEQMGTWPNGRKEFWWEREWRHRGDCQLPRRLILLCPEADIEHFRNFVVERELGLQPSFIDPRWGLEQIIARLAGFESADVDVL